MKKYLLPKDGNFYKANLHCHSTVSDGKLSPEELKKAYMEKGYSIIAYTDHNVLLSQHHLTDAKFLALNGIEFDITEQDERPWDERRTCHICMIAKDKDNLVYPCYNRENYMWGNAENYRSQMKFDESLPDFVREYNPKCINELIKEGREKGFFVTYNHPVWSLETGAQFLSYEGMNAMEICNYASLVSGYCEYCEHEYEEMLRSGKKIYCTATDDNHNFVKGRKEGSFGGFTMIKADKLEYNTITQALEDGNFYASQGPEIYDLYIEDGNVYIKTSPADCIYYSTGRRYAKSVYDEGEGLNEAVFNLHDNDKYFRITVCDKSGKKANTHAYFIEDLKD